MTADRVPSSSGESTVISAVGSWLLVIPSAFVGLLLVELFCRLFLPSIESTQSLVRAFHRVLFFDGPGTIFENRDDVFTFVPRSEMRNVAAFFSDNGFTIEYDYHFPTNNLGLVQDSDVVSDRASLLLLGDSFTEGLGAEPWFRLVSPTIETLGYQAVNGGLLGTGFEQWLKLDRFLERHDIRIQKVAVVFISDDYDRFLVHYPPTALRCLVAMTLCRVDENFFYRLPPQEELPLWIAKIRAARAPMMQRSWLGARAEALLPASYHIYKYFSDRLRHPDVAARFARAEQQSHAAIAGLIGMYGAENVAFIHLPQKDEISGGPDSQGLKARRAIKEAGGRLFDGFKLCRMTASDYYPNDDHPNSGGYAKIAVCVMNAIKELTAQAKSGE